MLPAGWHAGQKGRSVFRLSNTLLWSCITYNIRRAYSIVRIFSYNFLLLGSAAQPTPPRPLV